MRTQKILTGLFLVAVLAAAVFATRHFFQHKAAGVSAPVVNLKAKGNPHAPVTIEVFSDFECPACRFAVAEEERILAAYPDRVRFVFYHFPLSSHRLSPVVHQAAECAAMQGKFWPYHDRLYEKQPEWSALGNPVSTLMRYAREAQMDIDRFAGCLSDKSVTQDVLNDRKYGDALQVKSTPTFFIQGERFLGSGELAKGGVERIQNLLGEKKESV